MPTSVKLHPLVEQPLKRLKAALEAEFGVDASEVKIVNALIYRATAAQVVGMLEAFTRDAAKAAAPAPSSSPQAQEEVAES